MMDLYKYVLKNTFRKLLNIFTRIKLEGFFKR